MTGTTDHPARFSDELLATLRGALLSAVSGTCPMRVLDPFAGTGRIHEMACDAIFTVGVEIEREWAALHERTLYGDATALPFPSGSFDAVATSPAYGNRMADSYDGRDGSKRHTYRISLGRPLHDNNGGGLHWGGAYRELHERAWTEAYRVLRPGGALILNIKDHIRSGQVMPVSAWHVQTLCEFVGFTWTDARAVAAPGQRHGANGHLRLDHEWVHTFIKPGEPT